MSLLVWVGFFVIFVGAALAALAYVTGRRALHARHAASPPTPD